MDFDSKHTDFNINGSINGSIAEDNFDKNINGDEPKLSRKSTKFRQDLI